MTIIKLLDRQTQERLLTVYPDFSARVMRVYQKMYDAHERIMQCTEGYRTFAKQAEYYAQGRTMPGPIITRAKPGQGWHNYGLAVDSCFVGSDPYFNDDPKAQGFFFGEYARFCKSEGLTWGGDWNGNGIRDPNDWDRPHCELTYGMSLSQALQEHDNGGVRRVWERIDYEFLPKFQRLETVN